MAFVAPILTLASTGLQIYGMAQQGKADEMAARYNATLLENEAKNAELEFAEGAKRERITARSQLARARVALASSGFIASDGGTPELLYTTAASRFELGIADAARRSAMQTESIRGKAAMTLWESKQRKSANKLAMIGTGLAGLASVASQVSQNAYTGAGPSLGLYPRTR